MRFLPVDVVNDPTLIARNRRMISINGALSVDLLGQVVADTIGGRSTRASAATRTSSTGAGVLAEGGRSLICLPSHGDDQGRAHLAHRARVRAGTCVTTPRHQVDVIVTEYGAAELAGLTLAERAAALARDRTP